MSGRRRIALIWTQFSAYHVDRCEAAARGVGERAEVVAIEIATRSATYAWAPSGAVAGARKLTLFPGQSYDEVPWPKRLAAMIRALRGVDTVFVGVSYAVIDMILLSWWLRLTGRRVIMMTESKFNDRPRRIEQELLKPLIFLPYHGVMVGGQPQADYMRFLGYRRRPIVEGYDCVGLDRVRAMADKPPAPAGVPYSERRFVFVARFVPKKNVLTLVEAFERYAARAGAGARRLVLVGGGELDEVVRARVAASPAAPLIDLPGFLQAQEIAQILSRSLALILPSVEEQWGLVANEALAFNLPLVLSENVGSRSALLRNLCNGYVIEPESVEGFAEALMRLGHDEDQWLRMIGESRARAALADTPRFAAAVAELSGL